MRQLALAILGFTGAFVPLVGLVFLREALSDGLEGARLPLLSSSVLILAPIGPLLWVIPGLVAGGVYSRTGKSISTGDAVWAFVAALLLFGCVMGTLIAAYVQLLYLDGPNPTPHSGFQWAGNFLMLGASIAFAVLGFFRQRNPTESRPS